MTLLFLAQSAPYITLAWWKMLLMFLPFIGWGWLVATKLDKDARFFHLNANMWNSVHLGAGLAALVCMLFIPIFWASWPVGIFVMFTPIIVYWKVRNEAVPEGKQFYLSGATIADRMESRRVKKASRDALIHFKNSKGISFPAPMKDEPLYPIHMLAEDLFGPAIEDRATKVEMTITPKGCAIAQTVYGMRFKRDPIAAEDALKLFDYIKDLAGLDVKDRRRRQRGKCSLESPHGKTDLNITTSGSSSGQSMRLDFDLSKQINRPFDALGLLPSQIEELRSSEALHDRHGIFLIGAPRSHGLTSTSYALLGRHDAYIANIKSLEYEVQLQLDGPDQIQFDKTNPDIDYATNLQSILRRDPDIVLTAEIQDPETAQLIAESGMEGPLIYIPQSMGTIVEQIRSWVKLVGDVKAAARGLRCVMNQRLFRTLCPNCRQSYKPTPEQLRKLNLPANKVSELFKAGGKVEIKGKVENCQICKGTGYMGQTAAFEVFNVDSEIRKILATGDLKSAMSHARRNKMIYLQEAALSKVISGETSIEEVIRVTTTSKEEKKSPAPAS